MVTFLSWTANVRTSFFIGRTLAGNRIGLTLRSVGSTNMLPPVLSEGRGGMLFASVCEGFIRSCYGEQCLWRFLGFLFLLGVLCIWGVLVLLGSLLCTRLGLLRCASCWTRPLGGGRWGHYLCNLWREYLKVHRIAYKYLEIYVVFMMWEPYMLASAGQPSLHGYNACMVYWTKGALWRNCRLKQRETSFSPCWVFFCLVGILGNVCECCCLASLGWAGQASWAILPAPSYWS